MGIDESLQMLDFLRANGDKERSHGERSGVEGKVTGWKLTTSEVSKSSVFLLLQTGSKVTKGQGKVTKRSMKCHPRSKQCHNHLMTFIDQAI